MKRFLRVAVIVGCALAQVGCTSDGSHVSPDAAASDSGPGCGSTACLSRAWPRLIVVNQSGSTDTKDWHVSIVEAGVSHDALRSPCPMFPGAPQFACDFGFFEDGAEHMLALQVTTPDASLKKNITLEDSTANCRVASARVKVVRDASGALALSALQAFNPCTSL